jgi:hypothetical protein
LSNKEKCWLKNKMPTAQQRNAFRLEKMHFERKALIDILSLKPERIKIREEEVLQGLLF